MIWLGPGGAIAEPFFLQLQIYLKFHQNLYVYNILTRLGDKEELYTDIADYTGSHTGYPFKQL